MAYIHEGMAGMAGLSPEDIALLVASSPPASLSGLSPAEAEVMAYAKLWAESRGRPPEGMRAAHLQRLGPRVMADMEALLRTIDFANRSGNTLDSLLHFRDKRTEAFSAGEYVREFQGFDRQAWNRLEILYAATCLNDLPALPSNRLEALIGDWAGQYSIRINTQWRICFKWLPEAPGPSDVEVVDYH